MAAQYDFPKLKPVNILFIDGKKENPYSLEAILERSNLNVINASSDEEALRCINSHELALIVINTRMRGMKGYSTAELIRGNEKAVQIPIIFITVIRKVHRHILKIYESGPVDYIFKPIDPVLLNSKINMFIDLFTQKVALRDQNEKLQAANRKILEQQSAVIEEERLKLLFQITGASAHELNQPLMVLLGNIELLNESTNDPVKIKKRIKAIETAGRRISGIIKNIQNIRHVRTKTYPGGEKILDIGKSLRIFYVEDDDIAFEVIEKILKKSLSATLKRATTVEEAKIVLANNTFDLAMFDLMLPDGDSLELLEFVRAQGIDMPIVIITGYGNEKIASSCIHAGAHEYLAKGTLSMDEISHGINNAIERHNIQKVARQSITKMAELSTKDELTGLYNRRYMNERIEQDVEYANRYDHNFACLLLDLDHFKQINDIHGHVFGDFVLKEFARRLKNAVRKTDLTFRYGGEEFMVLLPEIEVRDAMGIAENIRSACQSEQFIFQDTQLTVTVSIGVASMKECESGNSRDIIAFADKALYKAKADGRNCVRRYQPGLENDGSDCVKVYANKGFLYLKEQLAVILEKTKQSSLNSIELLIKNIGKKTFEEQNRKIAQYINLVCLKLNLSHTVTNAIIHAASLHGCFSILLGDELLQKEGPVSRREKELIERHPHMLVELTDLFNFLSDEKTVLNYHHENYDGSGYPYGIKAEEIPLGARIFSIAEALVSMTSFRPYRETLSPDSVVLELIDSAGRQFDPNLVSLYIDIIAENRLLNVSEDVLSQSKQKIKQLIAENRKNG